MRVLGLLSFFDEPKELLALCIDGAARAGVDHIVAADGRYALFPSNDDVSPAEQRAVIDGACRHHGLGLTMMVPPGPWAAGEPEKRTWVFSMALASSLPGDWFWVLDADTIVTEAPADLHERLEASEQRSAMVTVVDTLALRANRPDWEPEFESRMLFLAQPIVVQGHHYDWSNPHTGEVLWRGADPTGLAEPLDLTGCVRVEHRPHARDPGRILLKDQYYGRRDRDGIEMGQCSRCEERACHRVYASLRMVDGLPTGLIEEVCEQHARQLQSATNRWLRQHGLDPRKVRFNERYSLRKAPAQA